jgi:hypothetical protein
MEGEVGRDGSARGKGKMGRWVRWGGRGKGRKEWKRRVEGKKRKLQSCKR